MIAPTNRPPVMTDDPLKLDRQVCFALAVASRTVISLYRPLLEPLHLTHPQYLVMLALWEQSPRSVKDLTQDIRLDSATLSPLLKRLEALGYVTRTRNPATLSPLLKRLEALGYVTRTRNPDDERALCLQLTPAGNTLREQALGIPRAVVKQLGIDEAELVDIHDRLLSLIDAATCTTARVEATS